MTFEEHLAKLKERQPDLFKAARMNISVRSFEQQLAYAFQLGQMEGKQELARELRAEEQRAMKDFFKGFGR